MSNVNYLTAVKMDAGCCCVVRIAVSCSSLCFFVQEGGRGESGNMCMYGKSIYYSMWCRKYYEKVYTSL